jgi:hypothetical protein
MIFIAVRSVMQELYAREISLMKVSYFSKNKNKNKKKKRDQNLL